MPKSIVAVLVVYVGMLLSACDTLYPLRSVPHLEVFSSPTQLYCKEPLIWRVREGSTRKEAICEDVAYSAPRYPWYGSTDTKQFPPFREIGDVRQVFCRTPAVWEVRNDPKGPEGSSKVVAICRAPDRLYAFWGWGPWGMYPGYMPYLGTVGTVRFER